MNGSEFEEINVEPKKETVQSSRSERSQVQESIRQSRFVLID